MKNFTKSLITIILCAGAIGPASAAPDPQCLNRCQIEYMQCLASMPGAARMQCDIQRDLCISRCNM